MEAQTLGQLLTRDEMTVTLNELKALDHTVLKEYVHTLLTKLPDDKKQRVSTLVQDIGQDRGIFMSLHLPYANAGAKEFAILSFLAYMTVSKKKSLGDYMI